MRNQFVATVATFIDDTIAATQATYNAEVSTLPAAEQTQRGKNLGFVFEKTDKAKKGVSLQVDPACCQQRLPRCDRACRWSCIAGRARRLASA